MSEDFIDIDARTRLLESKWSPVLDYDKKGFKPIQDQTKRNVTAFLLENMAGRKQISPLTFLAEHGAAGATSGTGGGGTGTFPSNSKMTGPIPMLMSIARRAIPNIIGFDVCGVQPMNAPTALILALKARYTNSAGAEALFNEADTDFSGTGTHAGTDLPISPDGGVTPAPTFTYGTGLTTSNAEQLGKDSGTAWAEMSMSLEGFNVTATSRAIKTRWTHELAEDLMKTVSIDARSELINMATTELVQATNREIIRTIYVAATIGAQDTTVHGIFNINTDSDIGAGDGGKPAKIKGLLYQIQKESTLIGYATRRGMGNFAIVSGRVYDALAMAGILDVAGLGVGSGAALLDVDISKNIFAGTVCGGRIKLYVDPFVPYGHDYVVVGYKGETVFDAGVFYCPYSPVQIFETTDSNQLQPVVGLKSRYAVAGSPFAQSDGSVSGAVTANTNVYYRKFLVHGLGSNNSSSS